MEITREGYVFEISHVTSYDDISPITISFEMTPIGYMDRYIDTVYGEPIHCETDLEIFAEKWIEENRNI